MIIAHLTFDHFSVDPCKKWLEKNSYQDLKSEDLVSFCVKSCFKNLIIIKKCEKITIIKI